MRIRFIASCALVGTTFMPGLAFAHTGASVASGFSHGFAHPFSGIDHLLAMVLVGIFAWQLGGRARWLVPAAFVAVMAFGGVLGVSGVDMPFVEAGIALSVVVLGAVVAFNFQASVAIAMGLAGLFALFHGHAHGTEMPEDAGGLSYALGFILATALLHIAGIGLGALMASAGDRYGGYAVRTAGGLAAGAGIGLLTGFI